MSTRLVQRINAGLVARYEDARGRIAAGASQRAACAAVGLQRGSFHRIARSLAAGATVLEACFGIDREFRSERELRSYIGRLGMASRWAGHTPVSRGSPEIERAYQREYRRERAARDPVYALYRRLQMRLRTRRRRKGAPGAEWLAVAPPRLHHKRLVLDIGLLPLLTEDERRFLVGGSARQGARP
jgi:hypothetical protein